MVVLSHFQAQQAIDAHRAGAIKMPLSLDLGMSASEVLLVEQGLQLPDGCIVGWQDLEDIRQSSSSCFSVADGSVHSIQYYSAQTDRLYSLYPTAGAASMLVSGIPMHRVKDTDPHQDTLEKIRSIRPVVGEVLDTATGLGYTAIEAARTALHVLTIELDPAALEVAKSNPWSQELFGNPKITQVIGDSFEVVEGLASSSFTRVIHDPPVFSLAGDLYSGEFYVELHRVMRNQSRLFHYIGDPESKSGRSITAGVMRRLEQAGFRQVRRAPRAFGVVAIK